MLNLDLYGPTTRALSNVHSPGVDESGRVKASSAVHARSHP